MVTNVSRDSSALEKPMHMISARASVSALVKMPRTNGRCSCVEMLDGADCLDEGYGKDKPRGSVLQEMAIDMRDVVQNIRRTTLLNPEAIEVLAESAPGLLDWLKTGPGFVLELFVFSGFVAVDVCKGLVYALCLKNADWEAQGVLIVASSLVLAQSLGVVVCCMTVGAATEGIRSWKQVLDVRGLAYKKFGKVAILFAMAQIFQTLAYTVMMPGTIKIVGQVRLLTTAVLSRFLLGRRYIETQWYVMVMIIMGALLHILAKREALNIQELELAAMGNGNDSGADLQNEAMGLGLIYLSIFFANSDIAVVVSDGISKEGTVPFWLQETVIAIMRIPIAFVMSFAIPVIQSAVGVDEAIWAPQMWWKSGSTPVAQSCLERTDGVLRCGLEAGGFWRDWDQGMIWVALILGCFEWLAAGFIVKILSATTKRLAKVIVFGLLYFLGDCLLLRGPQDGPISMGASLAAVQVMGLTHAFFMLKGGKVKTTAASRSTDASIAKHSTHSTIASSANVEQEIKSPASDKSASLDAPTECVGQQARMPTLLGQSSMMPSDGDNGKLSDKQDGNLSSARCCSDKADFRLASDGDTGRIFWEDSTLMPATDGGGPTAVDAAILTAI